MLTAKDAVARILGNRERTISSPAKAFAPSNIALCKYWGKRDQNLNLPNNSSISVSLGSLGTTTKISKNSNDYDEVFLDGVHQADASSFAKRTLDFVDLIRGDFPVNVRIETENNIPTAAGLASSASGFAALLLALNDFFSLNLSKRELSELARMGSGSATRSFYDGFAVWHRGEKVDGSDSFAEQIDCNWPDFRIGVLQLSTKEKPVSSRNGMNNTVEHSILYQSWNEQSVRDYDLIMEAIQKQDFTQLGQAAENNSMAMHATMIACKPMILYWQPESLTAMQQVQALRQQGTEVYFTMDAGPNVKLIFLKESEEEIKEVFPTLQIIAPFVD